jgi:hypothetical protein
VFVEPTVIYATAILATSTPGAIFSIATFYCNAPHGLEPGNVVVIIGADQPEFDGEFVVLTTPSATTFTYAVAATGVAAATSYNLGYIYFQQRLPAIQRAGTDSATFTLPGYATVTIYWGTETQPPDAYLNSTSGVTHPAYLGWCYLVFNELFFGFNQTNVPNIEVVVGRYPLPDWGAAGPNIQNDANPAYVVADLLQNPRMGLELPDALLDTVALSAAAREYQAAENLGVSKFLTRTQDVRSVLQQICETVDALPLINAAGLISWYPVRPAAVPADLPVIADANLTELPQITPSDWTTCYTQTQVTFSDSTLGFTDNCPPMWRDIGLSNIVGNPDINQVDRSWITRLDLATLMSAAVGQVAAIPVITGQLKLAWNDVLWSELAPGSLFLLAYSQRPAAHIIFRVTSRTAPDPEQPEFQIEFQADRTYLYTALINQTPASQAQQNAAGGQPAPGGSASGTQVQRILIAELPPGLCPDETGALGILVARPSQTINVFTAFIDRLGAWSGAPVDTYSALGAFQSFAWAGMLAAEYPPTTQLIDLAVGAQITLSGPDQVLATVDAFDAMTDSVLAFVDQEIMSLAGWTLTGPGAFTCQFIRGRFGSPIQDHAAGASIYMVSRAVLPVVNLPAIRPNNTLTLKVTVGSQSISAVPAISQAMTGVAWRVPPPCALAVNGATSNPVFSADPIVISWALPDPGGLLPRADIANVVTRLQFYFGAVLQYSLDVPWPATTASVLWAAISSGARQSFTLQALTVTRPGGWTEVPSFAPAILAVTKYP